MIILNKLTFHLLNLQSNRKQHLLPLQSHTEPLPPPIFLLRIRAQENEMPRYLRGDAVKPPFECTMVDLCLKLDVYYTFYGRA